MTVDRPPLRVLVIGAGRRVQQDVLPVLERMGDQAVLTGVWARTARSLVVGDRTHAVRSLESLAARDLGRCDLVYLAVSKASVPDVLERLGHTGHHVRVIANRFTTNDPLTPRDCEQFIGRAPDHLLPNDYQSMSTAVNEGRLLRDVAPKSALNAELSQLVLKLRGWCGVAAEPTDKPTAKAGLTTSLKRLFGKANNGTA